MWIYVVALLVILPAGYMLAWWLPSPAGAAREAARAAARLRGEQLPPSKIIPEGNSILSKMAVQKALEEGAPRTPWWLGKADRDVMDRIESYFAHAIPVPDEEGRAVIKETMGHGGPQLELYVPMLSSHNPVAIFAVSWDSENNALESNVFFFGNVPRRLSDVVVKSGFERGEGGNGGRLTVFRKRRSFAALRSA
ncbi:MAG TPA: hypothetical protein VM166_02190 [Gemmatimonadaceae bacterium]|nr:hypothetical protein [Gemmatimonadaceae bacterium]